MYRHLSSHRHTYPARDQQYWSDISKGKLSAYDKATMPIWELSNIYIYIYIIFAFSVFKVELSQEENQYLIVFQATECEKCKE